MPPLEAVNGLLGRRGIESSEGFPANPCEFGAATASLRWRRCILRSSAARSQHPSSLLAGRVLHLAKRPPLILTPSLSEKFLWTDRSIVVLIHHVKHLALISDKFIVRYGTVAVGVDLVHH